MSLRCGECVGGVGPGVLGVPGVPGVGGNGLFRPTGLLWIAGDGIRGPPLAEAGSAGNIPWSEGGLAVGRCCEVWLVELRWEKDCKGVTAKLFG